MAPSPCAHPPSLDDLGQVPVLSILHDDAQPVAVKEGLIVADDVGVLRGGDGERRRSDRVEREIA